MKRLEPKLINHIELLIARYPQLKAIELELIDAYLLLKKCYDEGGKILIAGNGGSAADSEHMVGELMKTFKAARKVDDEFAEKMITVDEEMGNLLSEKLQGALPAIALSGHTALSTACINDCDLPLGFAQQVHGFGKEKDILFALSTSGNSKNILYAVTVAKAKGLKVVALTGARESRLSELADVCIKAPETETYMVQELHLPIYHCLCLMLEDTYFE